MVELFQTTAIQNSTLLLIREQEIETRNTLSVKYFKLVTGEEVLADLLEENEDYYLVMDATLYAIVQNEVAGQPPKWGVAPLAILAENRIQLRKSAVVFFGEPTEAMANTFNEMYGKIVMASSDKIWAG